MRTQLTKNKSSIWHVCMIVDNMIYRNNITLYHSLVISAMTQIELLFTEVLSNWRSTKCYEKLKLLLLYIYVHQNLSKILKTNWPIKSLDNCCWYLAVPLTIVKCGHWTRHWYHLAYDANYFHRSFLCVVIKLLRSKL